MERRLTTILSADVVGYSRLMGEDEAGPLLPWLHAGLRAEGLAAICIETRRKKAALRAKRNKTDRNDARGTAQVMRTG